MLLSEAVDDRWELTVDGQVAAPAHRVRLGDGLGPRSPAAGQGSFRYRTAAARYALVLVQVAARGAGARARSGPGATVRRSAGGWRGAAWRRAPLPTVIDLTAEPPAGALASTGASTWRRPGRSLGRRTGRP